MAFRYYNQYRSRIIMKSLKAEKESKRLKKNLNMYIKLIAFIVIIKFENIIKNYVFDTGLKIFLSLVYIVYNIS